LGSANEDVLDHVHFLERVWVTTVEFHQQVSAQCVQLTTPFRPGPARGAGEIFLFFL